jgi:L-amino acid N-acyltransferase YncA
MSAPRSLNQDYLAGFAPITITLRDGRRVVLRAISPDDREAFLAAFNRLSSDARISRFMAPLKELPGKMLEHAVHPAPGREVALVVIADEGSCNAIVAAARYYVEPGDTTCEFAITVADDWHRVGLASRLMKELIEMARAQGLKRMEGFVLAKNTPMLKLARRLGFEVGSSIEGPTVKLVRLDLDSG